MSAFQWVRNLFDRQAKDLPVKRVLIIEDGDSERHFLQRVLVKARYDVVMAENGQDGLDKAREILPDLVICDYHLPKMNGNSVCRKIKDGEATKHIPVIFLTGSAKPMEIIECYEAGGDYYLVKPITAGDLLQQVKVTIQNSPSEAS